MIQIFTPAYIMSQQILPFSLYNYGNDMNVAFISLSLHLSVFATTPATITPVLKRE